MLIESTGMISLASWLLSKMGDNAFETISQKLSKTESIDKKFYKAVTKTSKNLKKKYPTVLGGNIDLFFKEEKIFNELIKLLFKDSVVDLNKINNEFDIKTLPKDFISEFITTLKEELSNDREINELFANKELFIITQGIDKNLTTITQNSTLTLNEIVKIKQLIQDRKETFKYKNFITTYSKNALHNLSQVNFIGLGVDLTIKRKRKNLQDVFVKPIFSILNQKILKQL